MRSSFVAISVVAFGLSLAAGGVAVAANTTGHVAFDAHGCPQGDVCMWSRPNFEGDMKQVSKAGCATDMPYIGSIVNNSSDFRFGAFKGQGRCQLDPLATTGRPVSPHKQYPEYDVHDTSYSIRVIGQVPQIH